MNKEKVKELEEDDLKKVSGGVSDYITCHGCPERFDWRTAQCEKIMGVPYYKCPYCGCWNRRH